MKQLTMMICLIGLAAGPGLAAESNAPAMASATVTNAQDHFEIGVRFLQSRNYAGAAESFYRAVEAEPRYPQALNNWGIALVQLGKQSLTTDTQLQNFQQAAEKFSKAAELNPKEKLTFILWSETLVLIGDMPVDNRVRLGCYQGAVDKCQRAIALAPTDWEPYAKWGAILSTKLPDFAPDDKTRAQLYREAAEKFDKAAQNARFASELGPLYANWGSALIRAARITLDTDGRSKLLTDAIEKFERSARAIPSGAATYAMWGNALAERGKITRLRSDFRDAIDRLTTSLSLNPKDPTTYYSLARVYAIQGNNVLAVDTLKKMDAVDTRHRLLREVVQDPDFTGLRGDRDFQILLGGDSTSTPEYNPRIGNVLR